MFFVPPYYNKLMDNIIIKIGCSDINVVTSVTNLDRKKNYSTNITSNELLCLSTKAS